VCLETFLSVYVINRFISMFVLCLLLCLPINSASQEFMGLHYTHSQFINLVYRIVNTLYNLSFSGKNAFITMYLLTYSQSYNLLNYYSVLKTRGVVPTYSHLSSRSIASCNLDILKCTLVKLS